METAGVVCSIVLGITLVVAGGSKIAAAGSWPEQARGLRAPRWAIPIVPWFEIVLGATLIVQLWPVGAALAALGLLVAFTVLIVARLRAGDHPPCACFGRWSAAPLGWGHVARNVALMALAVGAAVAT